MAASEARTKAELSRALAQSPRSIVVAGKLALRLSQAMARGRKLSARQRKALAETLATKSLFLRVMGFFGGLAAVAAGDGDLKTFFALRAIGAGNVALALQHYREEEFAPGGDGGEARLILTRKARK